MNAERARGKLWMAAWRYTLALAPGRLERMDLADAVAGVVWHELPPAFAALAEAAQACAQLDTPATDEQMDALRRAIDNAAAAARREPGPDPVSARAAAAEAKPAPRRHAPLAVDADDAERETEPAFWWREGDLA